ncbi:MAG: prenyltransferase/squalene oxidase repeat-containing protein, partial [Candidatus Bathyarchaeia archaeon]
KAAGDDPKSFGGKDCIRILKGFYNNGQLGDESLLNDDFWGLIALVSAGEEDQAIIDDIKAFIKANQNGDGGWSYGVGLPSDVDDTAAAIMALTATGEPKGSESIMKAVDYLKGRLSEDGGFIYDSTSNSASDSLAIMALEALNVDLLGGEWTRNGVNPIGHLLSHQNSDGSFSWRAGWDGEARWTAYAILALLGKPLILGFIVPIPDISNFTLTLLTSIIILSNALALIKLKTGKKGYMGLARWR